MTYRTADSRKQFDRWSRRYDWDPLQLLLFQPSHRLLLDALTAGDRLILDIGCGTGQFAERVLRRFPDTHVVGLDLSDQMLSRCQERHQQADGRLHRVQADSERLPFADDTFDVVTCAHSFHHYPRQEVVVAEMHRVLRPGGLLMIVDGDRDLLWGYLIFDVLVVLVEGAVWHRSCQAMRELYRQAGFEQIRQRRRMVPVPYVLTVGRAVKAVEEDWARLVA